MPLSFEMPPRLAPSPSSAPIHQVVHPIFLNEEPNLYPDKNPKSYMQHLLGGPGSSGYETSNKLDLKILENTQGYWQQRLTKLNKTFHISGEVQQLDTPDRLIMRNERYNLHVYKASNSFLYFDNQLVSPTNPAFSETLLPELVARKKADDLLKTLGLLDEHVQFAGIGYTGVLIDHATPDETPELLSDEYKTEIKVHYRFIINGLPVFGPGAKVIASYVGQDLSQLIYFWRNPKLAEEVQFASSKVNQHRPISSPEEALYHFSHDSSFEKLKKGNAKVRFHDLRLGYYAKSPLEVQRFIYPVYQVKGTVETWKANENGYAAIKEQVSGDVFRQDFTLHMLAVSDPNLEEKKMFGPNGKTVTTF